MPAVFSKTFGDPRPENVCEVLRLESYGSAGLAKESLAVPRTQLLLAHFETIVAQTSAARIPG